MTVLFIGGLGHSGSTLLMRLLGQLPSCVPVGELGQVWQSGFARNLLCGCGVPFRDCAFWNPVVREAFGGFDGLSPATIQQLSRFWDRRRHVAPFIFSTLRTARHQRALDHYVDHLGRLLHAVRKVSGRPVVIDASKTPLQLVALTTIPDVEVHVIHLIRDSRAVAHSWAKPRRRRDVYWTEEFFPAVHPATTALLWNGANILTAYLQRRAMSSCQVRYEDFVRTPDEIMRWAAAQVGTPLPNDTHIDLDDLRFDVHHSIAGHPMRFESGSVVLRARNDWTRQMARPSRLAVTALTWPLLWSYSYPLWLTGN